jgi:uncharacterized repeat protein (TIGR03803 family)
MFKNFNIFFIPPKFNSLRASLWLVGLLWLGLTNVWGQKLIGVAPQGGTYNLGTIYQYDFDLQSLQTLHHFENRYPGANPENTELVEYQSKFYGMTVNGGANGQGVIFEWEPISNAYVKKFDFSPSDGGSPFGSLALYNGKFYGMTIVGGANNAGVIFEWNPTNNVYTKKIDLSSTLGKNPRGTLTLHNNKFYGMTSQGGANNVGVIFEWDPNTNAYTKKIDLSSSLGGNPHGNLAFYNGLFYGMTSWGGANNVGVIFEWNPTSNAYTKKIDFNGSNGASPQGSLIIKEDIFYGMTTSGGTQNQGVIFAWNPANNTYTKRYDFYPQFGYPKGNLTVVGDFFYGVASEGNLEDDGFYGQGAVFKWSETDGIEYGGFSAGERGGGSLVLSGNKLYGLASRGDLPEWAFGGYATGSIYEVSVPDNFTPTTRIRLNVNKGFAPNSLIYHNGKYYGTAAGGAANLGVLFEWNPASGVYTARHDFGFSSGGTGPYGLVSQGDKLYGVARSGYGPNFGGGGIFQFNPATQQYTSNIEFDYEDDRGSMPRTEMTFYNGKFYGVTPNGGANNAGVLFEWYPSNNQYTKKLDFESYANSLRIIGTLLEKDGVFYGLSGGGSNNVGAICEWNPVTNQLIERASFNGTNGSSPQGSLSLKDGKFYGMTANGGANGQGVIFEWNPTTNTLVNKFNFGGNNGRYPQEGGLLLYEGKFYGVVSGGITEKGFLFEWNPDTNIFTKLADFNGTNGEINQSIKLLVVPTVWQGANTANWNDPANWSGGKVPNGSDEVIIPANVQVTINSNVEAGNLTLPQGSSLVIGDGGNLELQSFTGEGEVVFSGTTPKTIPANMNNIAKLTINNASEVSLTEPINVSNVVNIQSGSLNLAGNNLNLGDNGQLNEDLANNHLIKDLTAIDENTPGGAITATNRLVSSASDDIAGLGFEAQRTTGFDYAINVTRYHYQALNTSIARVYGVTGEVAGTNTTLRINYSDSELAGIAIADLRVLRYSENVAPLGWNEVAPPFFPSATLTAGTNYVEVSNINSFSLWTLGESIPALNPIVEDVNAECSVTLTAPVVNDPRFGDITGTTTDPLTYSEQGTYQVNWSFTDGNGNTVTVAQNVVVDDVTAPAIPTLANATGECSVVVVAPTTTDNCAGTITGTTTDPLTYSLQGTYQITWTFDDGNGNQTTTVQNVVVDDVTAPIISLNGSSIINLEAGTPYIELGASASDNCAEGLSVVVAGDVVNTSLVGTYIITYNVNDGNGNAATQVTRTVQVQDTTPPTAPVLSVGAITTTTIELNWSGATDNVGVTNYEVYNGINLVTSLNSGTYTVTGLNPSTNYTFTVKAQDAAGNSSGVSNQLSVSTQAEPITTTQRLEVENGFTKITDLDNDVIVTRGGGATAGTAWSNGLGVSLPDIGDKIQVNFNAPNSGQYIIKVRVRAGNSTNATLFWPDKYGFTFNNAPLTLVGNLATISAISSAFGGSYFGTMESAVLNLTAGNQALEIATLRTAGAIDYLEIISLGGSDNVAPTAPVLSLASASGISIGLTWSGATDNVGVVAYEVYQGTDLIATPNTTTYLVTGLSPNTAYSFSVKAQDAAGNTSIASNVLNVSTTPAIRYEAETNYSVMTDADGDVVVSNGGNPSAFSQNLGVRLSDSGDRIRIHFNVANAGQYLLKMRVRAGTASNSTIFWTGNHYSFRVDGISVTFVGNPTTLSELSSAFTGSYFGTMETGTFIFNAGNHFVDITTGRSTGAVDYFELIEVNTSLAPAAAQQTLAQAEQFHQIVSVQQVYPNPSTQSHFQIALSDEMEGDITCQLFDQTGRLVASRQIKAFKGMNLALDLSEISQKNGIYFLQIGGSQLESRTIKIVKN